MDRNLVKVELLESFSWAYRDKKTGKRRAIWKTIVLLTLYALAFAWLMFTFYIMGRELRTPLLEQDLEWLFFVLMGLLSMQVVGLTNAFHAYSALNRLLDEEALPESARSVTRMVCAKFAGTYIMGLFYSLVFVIPGVIVHLQFAETTILGAVFTISVPILLGLLSLAESIFVAWIVRLVSKKIRNKNVLTVVLSLGLVGCYYALYERSQDIFRAVVENAAEVAAWVKRLSYPLYRMGLGTQGDLLSMAVFCATTILIVALTGFLLWLFYRRSVLKRRAQQN